MKKLPIEYISNRKNYYLFKKDTGVSTWLREGKIWEEVLHDIIKDINLEGTVIVDIGANLGAHTLEFADKVGNTGCVYAFEPQRIVYYQLCTNIFINGYDNIYAFNKALSDKNGITHIEEQDFYFNGTLNIGNTHIMNHGKPVEEMKLDDFNLNNVSLIKIDVQGYEPFVLKGSIETIKRNKPIILIEIEDEHLSMFNKSSSDIISFLNDCSYVIFNVNNFDYLAIPKDFKTKLNSFKVSFSDKLYIESFIENFKNCKLYVRDPISKIIYHNQILNFDTKIQWWFIFDWIDELMDILVQIYDENNILVYEKIISKK